MDSFGVVGGLGFSAFVLVGHKYDPCFRKLAVSGA
jgi:hypothetical protein